jgi:hypothetical protein
MPEPYVKFLKKGFNGERLRVLKTDGLRWRWWRLYCLSDYETFPGLIGKGLVPLTEHEIVGSLYQSHEFNGGGLDRILVWRNEKMEFLASKLVKSCVVSDKEFLWNTDFHSFQDKHSTRGKQFLDKFYVSFIALNDFDKALFIILLDKFRPENVDLKLFSIPEYIPQIDGYVNKKGPLFGGSSTPETVLKNLMSRITERVEAFVNERKKVESSDTKEFVNWWCAKYREVRKSPYMRGGKDYGLVADMLKVFSIGELQAMATRFLIEEDVFVKKAGYTIGVLKSMVNRLVMRKEKRPIGVDNYDRPIRFES